MKIPSRIRAVPISFFSPDLTGTTFEIVLGDVAQQRLRRRLALDITAVKLEGHGLSDRTVFDLPR
ncbi:hypothetical protein [Mesorhizobium sp. ES1-4]|uniref:hypothetical protein n=1 Tax=Mesorhizobium sp. ES1-4 TaxID=2876627 RepID=UPI001CCD6EAE|nr:hypothetical protein [Mesorhizobium sp. ES1-4]MBZ9797238.1 hypothetical protein [Mesorhizobium sp. ES1-4]